MPNEIRRVVECPSCQFAVVVSLLNFQGRIRMFCSQCKQPMTNRPQGAVAAQTNKHQVVKKTAPLQKIPNATAEVNLGRRSGTAERISLAELQEEYHESGNTPLPIETHVTQNPYPENPSPLGKLGQYSLLKVIGRGTMGEIYLAQKEGESEYTAIKILNRELQKDPAAEVRFKREADVQSRLKHPNIVQIKDADKHNKRLYLAMEYIQGKSLSEILQAKGSISQKHSLQIAIAIAHALEHALEHNIIHRDLKPGNVLIEDRSRRVKLADFGLGKILEEKGDTLTGQMMGTAYYMPPEQIKNAKEVDHRADIYSLGATLYHMLAGQPPYGEIKTLVSVLRAKITQDPLPLGSLVKGVSPDVIKIAETAMAKNPANRYQDPTQMKEHMNQVLAKIQ